MGRMTHWVVLFVALLTAPSASIAACRGVDLRDRLDPAMRAEMAAIVAGHAYAEGNHWRATRDGRVITVIGTMHISDPRMDAITDRLAPVVAAADVLLLEVTKAEEAALGRAITADPSIAFLTEGPTLIDRLPPDVWSALSDAAQARGVPAFVAAKYQPWFLSLTLAVAPCAVADFHRGKKGLDHRLTDIATASAVPVDALETALDVIEVLAAEPIDEQIRFLPLAARMERFIDDTTATTIEAYFDERHGELLAFGKVFTRAQIDFPAAEFDQLFNEMMAQLLDQRNLAWMERIEARSESDIVVAVGAAHLGGETGLLNQLALRGYTLERQPF